MKYYTNYSEQHPKLDRFIHVIARLLFAVIAFVATYVIQIGLIFQDSSGYRFSEEWTENGASVFYSPLMLIAPIFMTIMAFLAPQIYRRVTPKSD